MPSEKPTRIQNSSNIISGLSKLLPFGLQKAAPSVNSSQSGYEEGTTEKEETAALTTSSNGAGVPSTVDTFSKSGKVEEAVKCKSKPGK